MDWKLQSVLLTAFLDLFQWALGEKRRNESIQPSVFFRVWIPDLPAWPKRGPPRGYCSVLQNWFKLLSGSRRPLAAVGFLMKNTSVFPATSVWKHRAGTAAAPSETRTGKENVPKSRTLSNFRYSELTLRKTQVCLYIHTLHWYTQYTLQYYPLFNTTYGKHNAV